MSEIKLLPCPFCGGEVELSIVNTEEHNRLYWIYCKGCGTRQQFSIHLDYVIKKWNTRKPMQEIVERLEESYQFFEAKKKEAYEDGEWEYFDRYMNINRGIYEALALVEKVGGMNG